MSNIIHIGFHKTGTTWFQRNFYPYVTNARYVDRRDYMDYLCNTNALAFDPETFGELSGISETSNNILCLEEISGNFNNGGYNGYFSKFMGETFHQLDPKARIIIFIRNQVDMISSCYQQYIKEGGTYSAEKYIFNRLEKYRYRAPVFMLDHFKYSLIISHYKKLFGDNVFVYVYEHFQKDNKAFCQQFSEDHGLTYQEQEINFTARNLSVGYTTLTAHRFLNNFTPGDVAHKSMLLDLGGIGFLRDRVNRLKRLRRFFGTFSEKKLKTGQILDKSTIEFIRSYYREDNERLMSDYHLDLETDHYFN